ncbi:hypothetical protein E2C01_098573 [Portunus trituberculatus]|uniref:Uncharacterized protein n=1 Tax=Portunus trituberculatus TaxID=210409 RepID=A0A5B7K8L9_PORTR|nr:hypothetical protein [Portunus trituberculatus]
MGAGRQGKVYVRERQREPTEAGFKATSRTISRLLVRLERLQLIRKEGRDGLREEKEGGRGKEDEDRVKGSGA